MPLTLNGTTGIVTGNLADAAVTTPKIADSAVVTVDLANGAVTAAKLSGGQTGSAPVYGCRAWVNFDGTRDASGTASTANTNRFIRSSGNVSSVLRNGGGSYTVTFALALSDVNFSGVGNAHNPIVGGGIANVNQWVSVNPISTTALDVFICNQAASFEDCGVINVAIFG